MYYLYKNSYQCILVKIFKKIEYIYIYIYVQGGPKVGIQYIV